MARCENCGAPLPPNLSGCLYCGAGKPVISIPELSSAIAAGDDALRAALPRLAQQLTQAIPDSVQVERHGHFGKSSGTIKLLRAHIDGETFVVQDDKTRLQTMINQELGGVVMQHQTVTPKQWGERISAALQRYREAYR